MKQSYWIWSFGDFEIYHYNLVHTRREDREMKFPPFWKLPDVDKNVRYFCDFEADTDGYIKIFANGQARVYLDDVAYSAEEKILVSKGYHNIIVYAMSLTGLPAIFAESDICPTDGNWYTWDKDCKHIEVGFDEKYDSIEKNPEQFIFSYERIKPISEEKINGGTLFDFGKETFGYLYIENADRDKEIFVNYGESRIEALSGKQSVVFETVSGSESYKLRQRAFRYIFVDTENVEIYADYEYLPLDKKGSFACDDEKINKIWEICAYTYHLNCREVLLDGIKRDRWCWSGDAYQCFKFNNYLFFDKDIVKRTLIGLGGNDMVVEPVNTITDYTFYWIISLYEYYMSFADIDFIKHMFKKVEAMLEFMKTRENEDGFIVKRANDWIFIDWSDIDKGGTVCAEQMLYIAANKAAAELARVIDAPYEEYANKAKELTSKVNEYYWNGKAFIDCYDTGKNNVTRHANIFAIMYDIATEEQRESIIENVLLNDSITKITTPFFEGFELDVMGRIGRFDYIENMLSSYWGAMLDLGARTIWEEFDPSLSGDEHYGMYGDGFGKSLCHAWGASPIYLLGKYYLGVRATKAGYEEFVVEPRTGGFNEISGTVPVNGGIVKVKLNGNGLSILTDKEGGTLIWKNKEYKLAANEEFVLN